MDYLKLAEELENKYPKADLIGMTDETLADYVRQCGIEPEQTPTWAYQVKIAWTHARRGGPEDTSMQVDL